jgi:hypothetical protein
VASKYFCDGCGMELGNGITHNKRLVLIEDTYKQITLKSGDFDLCNSCTIRLDSNAMPSSWVRCSPAKKAS